jgi:hypothetical protein
MVTFVRTLSLPKFATVDDIRWVLNMFTSIKELDVRAIGAAQILPSLESLAKLLNLWSKVGSKELLDNDDIIKTLQEIHDWK